MSEQMREANVSGYVGGVDLHLSHSNIPPNQFLFAVGFLGLLNFS